MPQEPKEAQGELWVVLQFDVVGPVALPVVLHEAASETCWSTMYWSWYTSGLTYGWRFWLTRASLGA